MNMNHKFLSYLTPAFMAIAMGLGFAACSEDAFDSGSESEGQITITLSSSKVASRATTPGEDRLNENLIGETRLYFYPESSSDTEQPIFEHSVDPNKTSSATVTLLMKQAKDLFGETGNTCKVYALTNIPDWSKITDDHSRSALRRVAITSPFENIQAQTSFVMDGEGTVTLDRDNQSAKGTIQLVRSAAKIILSVNVADEIEENGAKWHSNTNDMFVSFAHIVKTSIVDNKTDDSFMAPDFENDMVSKPVSTETGHKFIANTADNKDTYPFVQEIPFYTYPNKCIDATADTDVKHPYITFMVQWQKQGEAGAEAQYCYYQIPIGKHGDMKLDRNNIYRINLNVSKLGSFVETEAVELDMSYEVVNWSSVDTDVDIEDYRYLVLNQTEYTMNNENEITIPFYSSHDVELANVTLTYFRYNESSDGSETTHTVTPAQNEASRTNPTDPRSGIYDVSYDNVNKTLTFYHDLKKTWTLTDGKFTPNNEDAYSPYKMVFTFHHTDKEANDAVYAKTVTITQYPAMYIQVEESPALSAGSGYGYVYINNNNEQWYSRRTDQGLWNYRYYGPWKANISQNTDYENEDNGEKYNAAEYYIGSRASLTGWGAANNTNPNNYIINITKLNDLTYKIADPRSNEIDNVLGGTDDQWALNGTNQDRSIKYYYPTDESADKSSFVAPSICVASSRGATERVSRIGAKRRCASYQENGRPAGRWRVPTSGEIKYIVNLSSQKKIPYLFGKEPTTNNNPTLIYWSASGAVEVTNNYNAPGSVRELNEDELPTTTYVRCVYDEWYWKDKCDKGTFTWGDRPYQNPEDDK